ncbi:Bacterial type II secretion system protein F domain protein [Aquisphaera giovannonii]|uniref:Bacterial type II secretion system protein F domain protein n=1 Tax=Aquisphaera giovannonii TaxID=406548 RepID=A0A5B9W2E2_9BACT|nr:type II secretion system F family protein [Aquisphaera giovannonii]QEH34301.1 Bacterial type II secretion system protein F domain protein [Aquisphaera giovannonii]
MTISLQALLPLLVFCSISMAVWAVMTIVLGDRNRGAEDRLRRIMSPGTDRKGAEHSLAQKQEKFQEQVARAANKLGQSLRPTDEQELGKVRVELLNAGFRSENAVAVFFGVKMILMSLFAAIVFPVVALKEGVTLNAFTYTVAAGGLGFYIPGLVVGSRKKKRSEDIFLGLPDALDLMVVCVEAGLGLDAAMRRVTAELATSCKTLCEEFAIANFQLQMGRPRKDVLRDLGVRTGVDDMRSLAAVIIQAEKFGSSIGAALRVQSDALRLRRRQFAEERAAKTAVKIMIPLILFIFPGVFVVLVGPAGIQIANTIMAK